MENLTILEKASILQGKKKIISPIGANLMNFIFLREDVRIGVIGHPGLNQFKWFQKLLMSVNPSLNILLFDEVYAENSTQNSPYSVNIEEFDSWISNF
jgi:capsular polysaccharide biosynthesis protein